MKKYYTQTSDQEDLISIGTIGLIKGITTFDPSKGARLATYAARCVEKGHKLFYWKGKSSAELEFIVESDNKLYPIDVKKGKGTLKSLQKFANHNKFEAAIKVSKNHYGYNPEQKLLAVPFYVRGCRGKAGGASAIQGNERPDF